MFRALALSLLLSFGAAGAAPSARADDGVQFVERFSGEWLGTGRLLFGPQFGAKFHCELKGSPNRVTFAMSGRCWMGDLSGPVRANIRYNAETGRFYGDFMDGAEGQGVDIIGLRSGEGFTLKLSRGQSKGTLLAEPVGSDQMTITMSVRDEARNRDFPVVAMGFTRKEASALGLPDYMPNPATGSIGKAP